MPFRDRTDAGRQLALRLVEWADSGDLVNRMVLALPRGGVPVGAEISRALHAPLDVLVARKIGAPGRPETAVGALVDDEPAVFDSRSLDALELTEDAFDSEVARERDELHRREHVYRGDRPAPDVRGRAVVLVDDGLATGLTATAALRHLRRQSPGRLVLAVPVCSPHAAGELRAEADDLVCLEQPGSFRAVGEWYEDFAQLSDIEVVDTLRTFHATA
ncbi:phosphoribosyltransferase [Streptomyces sp. MK5]|uniref:phosphoribosyltransferase n=1 Tax=Streptomyces sp. MK5 TaxID=3064253 RepID=UPI0027426794|nr:phosphoribosyltransferase [Streptomyces sp. MK5]